MKTDVSPTEHEHRFEPYASYRIRPKGGEWGPWIYLEQCRVKVKVKWSKRRLPCGKVRRKPVDP